MQLKISNFLKKRFVILIAVLPLGSSVFAQEVTRVSIDITINGTSSDEDYIVYYYKGIMQKNITGKDSVTQFSGKDVTFIAHGSFKDWEGSSCGSASGKVLEFTTSGDCKLIANFGAAEDPGRRRK